MKNKPQRHKESNAFRVSIFFSLNVNCLRIFHLKFSTKIFQFKTFGERINEIDLRRSALYRIRHENENTDDDTPDTEFHQTYLKWIVLNLTEEYNGFQKQIRGIVTLPQLLLKKDFVVNKLIDAMENATILSMQPLLE